MAGGAFAFAAVFAGELDIAKSALRDGLWEIARSHAAKVEGEEAQLVVLESYAREGRWDEVRKTIDAHPEYPCDGFTYYRALAQTRTGEADLAASTLATNQFKDTEYEPKALLLRAELARSAGKAMDLLAIAADAKFPKDDVDARMLVAWAKDLTDDSAGAEAIWRDVIASSNVTEAALATSATSLGDADSLRKVYDRLEGAPLKRSVGLRLGRALLSDGKTFAEGERMIRFMSKDAPDADGAKEAFVALAGAYLARDDAKAAAEAYRAAIETWPDVARETAAQEGRGWALRKLGRTEEALDAFARAEESAKTDVDKARTLMEQGDVLAESGRGDEAMAKYRAVLGSYPETPAGRKLKVVVELRDMESDGRAKYRNFRFREAQSVFESLAQRDPERRPRMDYLVMLCLYGQGRDEEAARKAESIAAASPDAAIRAEATLWLAKFSYNAHRWKEACGLFSKYASELVPNSPQAPSALLWAARAAFAARDYEQVVSLVTKLATGHPDSVEKASAWLVQGEALVELARLDEAILVLEKVILTEDATQADKFRARMLKADVLFVMGADNPSRYREALDGYRALQLGESLTPDQKLVLAFKVGRTLEKTGRTEEALDQYYAEVVHAYRDGRKAGVVYGEEAMATFARAAFILADAFERRGEDSRAKRILRLVVNSDVATAVPEASRRLERLQRKGAFQ